MNKQSFSTRFMKDVLYRNKITLILVTSWDALLFVYYFLAGWFDENNLTHLSWWYGLAFWYGILTIFKIAFCSCIPYLKKKKRVNFTLATIIYLFINFFEVIAISLYPTFISEVFKNKLNKGLSLASIVINIVNLVLFVLSWIPFKKKNLNDNEISFIKSKQYLSRTEGFFNILLIAMNIIILVDASYKVLSYTYLGICSAFALLSLILAIRLVIKDKVEVATEKVEKKWKRRVKGN